MRTNMQLHRKDGFSFFDIENFIPWELEVYITILRQSKDEEAAK